MAWLIGISVEIMSFRMVDVRDEDGLQVRLRIAFKDRIDIREEVTAQPLYQDFLQDATLPERLPTYVANGIFGKLTERDSIWRALFVVEVCQWWIRRKEIPVESLVIFLERRPWRQVIHRHALDMGAKIIWVTPSLDLSSSLRRRLNPRTIATIRFWKARLFARNGSRSYINSSKPNQSMSGQIGKDNGRPKTESPGQARIAVECLGPLNLDQPERQSELFFWQRSSLQGSDLLLTFVLPAFPLTVPVLKQLQEQGIQAVALSNRAVATPEAPVYAHHPGRNPPYRFEAAHYGTSAEARWIRNQVSNYNETRDYWRGLFETYGIKVFAASNKLDAHHCAMADAIQDLGGVSAIYQISYESNPAVWTPVSADVVFTYSQSVAEVEHVCDSRIRYNVTTGYLGDHRFALLSDGAQEVRQRLMTNGAERILAYFDDNSIEDPKWGTDNQWMRENYAYLLEKLLANPWLGLLFKPKGPASLRQKLGPVLPLLEEAEATGRCFVYEGEAARRSHPPAEAALAADIAIHGHLYTGSAGIDAALAGVPTLLLDREGWHVSPLYELGVGKVAFTDWDSLWESCREHWSTPGGVPGLGDWSSKLDKIDPFRDGRAAQRMGEYLKWLIEGFQAGLEREEVLAGAANRYSDLWGADKITEVNGSARPVFTALHRNRVAPSNYGS